jgi:hypothetical protein
VVLSMLPRTLKLDEEKSKCAGLDQENGFWLRIIVQFALVGERRTTQPTNALHLQKRM